MTVQLAQTLHIVSAIGCNISSTAVFPATGQDSDSIARSSRFLHGKKSRLLSI